jgi:hypothetical protein
MSQYPILITTAIKPPDNLPYLVLSDHNARLAATKAAILYWVAQGSKNIVVVDSTNTSPLNKEDFKLLRDCGTKIEVLTFRQDQDEIMQHGKGFGEGNIIKHAIENSKLLQCSEYFYKITGKCFCRNFEFIDEIVLKNNIKTIFWKLFDRNFAGNNLQLADTRFYFSSKSFFMNTLYPVYQNAKNVSVERLLVDTLNEHLTAGYVQRSQISGFAGGVGGKYQEQDLGYLEYQFPVWFRH